jgi:hypothetical protein
MGIKNRLGFIVAAVLLTVPLLCGCETTKGAATGVEATVQGAAKDGQNFWQTLVKADDWMRKNLW